MSKAVVFSVKDGVAMVLERGGQFRKVPAKEGWRKGDVVGLPGAGRPRSRRLIRYYANVAVGLLLVVSLISYATFYYVGKTVTYVSIDINPSIELSLNNFDQVIAATSYNPEGSDALEEVDLKGMSVAKAIAALLSTHALEPFLEGNQIVVTISCDTNRPELASEVYGAVRDLEPERGGLLFSGAGWDETKQAQELGVSLGKLSLAKQVQAKQPDTSLEELVERPTQELLDALES